MRYYPFVGKSETFIKTEWSHNIRHQYFTPANPQISIRYNFSLHGHTWTEHNKCTSIEERKAAHWSSMMNDEAFWLTERSLQMHLTIRDMEPSLSLYTLITNGHIKCGIYGLLSETILILVRSRIGVIRISADRPPWFKMKILFIHQSFPGQFKHLFVKLQAHNVDLSVICSESVKNKIPGISYFYYRISKGNGSDTHPLALETESKVIRGEAVAAVAKNLRNSGYIPNLIIAHPGWGESLFLKHIWPTSPQLHYVEYMYGSAGTDVDFVDVHSPPSDWKEAQELL